MPELKGYFYHIFCKYKLYIIYVFTNFDDYDVEILNIKKHKLVNN